jgi:Mce-associated membrane protein
MTQPEFHDSRNRHASNGRVTELNAATTCEDTPTEDTAETTAAFTSASSADNMAEAADTTAEPAEAADQTDEPHGGSVMTRRHIGWKRVVAFGVLPGLALLLTLGAGYLKWRDSSVRDADLAQIESVQAAKDSTTALLSYRPDTVDKDLGAARNLLTGDFKNAYTSLTNDVVIPGAKQKQISAVASVRGAASLSADPRRAVVLVFVNQTVIMGTDAPTDTASSVKVTMDKQGDRWLISGFDPV